MRVLRRRGDLVISETRHGFVCANAGIDLSNVAAGHRRAAPGRLRPLRAATSATRSAPARGVDVAVIVSDTFGRPWRIGLTDVAIGVAGIAAVVDLRGETDALGRELQVTEVAIADEIASAAELVMGKARGVPAAIVRGLDPEWFGDGRGARPRPAARRGPVPVTPGRPAGSRVRRGPPFDPRVPPRAGRTRDRSTRSSRPRASPRHRTTRDRGAGSSSTPPTGKAGARRRHGRRSGARDLDGDGVDRRPASTSSSRRRTGKLTGAPALVLGCLTWDGLDRYPDAARQRAEWGMALLSLGAAVENLMLAAADAGLASCWVAAPIFCPEAARDALAPRPDDWLPHALVLVGHPDPTYAGRPRPPVPLDELRTHR